MAVNDSGRALALRESAEAGLLSSCASPAVICAFIIEGCVLASSS